MENQSEGGQKPELTSQPETQRATARQVVRVLNEGVAEYRLKRSGVENPTPEQISKEAAQTPGMLGQEDVLVEDRGQYFEDLNEWLNTTLENRYLSEKSEQDG